ncbi:MAG: hypothetical protein R2932_59145 [Caldilineaceae bacterium]
MATRPKPRRTLNTRRRRTRPRWDEEAIDDLAYTLLGPARRLSPEGQRVIVRQMEQVEAILAARRLTKLFKTSMEGDGDEDT